MHDVLILTDKSASYRIVSAAETNKDGTGVAPGKKMQSAKHQGGLSQRDRLINNCGDITK